MKHLTVIAAILLTGAANIAHADDTDTLLGAAAGAAVGSTIGKGDGRTIATVIGGLIGANMARDAAESRAYGYAPTNDWRYERDIRRQCENMAPSYRGYPDARRAWVQGCMQRQKALLLEMQDQAYHDGLDGRN